MSICCRNYDPINLSMQINAVKSLFDEDDYSFMKEHSNRISEVVFVWYSFDFLSMRCSGWSSLEIEMQKKEFNWRFYISTVFGWDYFCCVVISSRYLPLFPHIIVLVHRVEFGGIARIVPFS